MYAQTVAGVVRRGAARRWAAWLAAAVLAASQAAHAHPATAAQTEVSDLDLERVGGAHTVTVGALRSGVATTVPIEVYVARVLAGEGEPGAPPATQEALAVAIRTYAIFNAGRHRRDGFDLCDSTHCQVPRAATADSRRAALATAGRILTYQGSPAEVFYSASCGGRSETASAVWPRANLPYLRSVADDVHDEDEPWTLDLSLDEIEGALRRSGFTGTLRNVEAGPRTDSGRVARLRLSGMEPATIAGDQFRATIGAAAVRSTAFRVARRGSMVRFTGRGYGHGVGMCVVGAGRRARRGENAERILAQYYPGLKIAHLGEVAQPQVIVAEAPAASTPARQAR